MAKRVENEFVLRTLGDSYQLWYLYREEVGILLLTFGFAFSLLSFFYGWLLFSCVCLGCVYGRKVLRKMPKEDVVALLYWYLPCLGNRSVFGRIEEGGMRPSTRRRFLG